MILAFILGVIFFTGKTEEEKLKQLSGREKIEYARELERRKIQERTRKFEQQRRRGVVKQYDGPNWDFYPYKEDEEMVITVCRSLFNISTLLETDTNVKTITDSDNFRFLVGYYRENRETTLREILKLLRDYSSKSTKSRKQVILLKICGYLYNKGCEKHSHESVFKMCKMYRK